MTPPGQIVPRLLPATLLTIAVLLRAGVVPVHCWMTDLFEHASFGTAILFVAPMTGAYAVMHLVLPFGPSWAMRSIAVLSLITAVYAAGMATIQKDARRFFCYLVSESCFAGAVRSGNRGHDRSDRRIVCLDFGGHFIGRFCSDTAFC